jgi:hypothetical protein
LVNQQEPRIIWPTNLVTDSGGSVNEGTSEVAVNVGDEGEAVVLVFGLQNSGLGSLREKKTNQMTYGHAGPLIFAED